jgi:adenine-specific DNA-methyltransferase
LSDQDDFVLDFFAGSCSTAHAVLNTNRLRLSSRKFICVQLPEPVNPKTHAGRNALELGLKTVADIGKERIRRVIARMKKERAIAEVHELPLLSTKPEDLGFKVFKLAESNYKQWDGAPIHELAQRESPESYARQAELFADPLVEGWKPENLLYEVALKEGYGLNIVVTVIHELPPQTHELPLQTHELTPQTWRVTDPDKGQSFYLCLANRIALKSLKPLNLHADDLFICRDAALDDEAAANLALQCRLKTI